MTDLYQDDNYSGEAYDEQAEVINEQTADMMRRTRPWVLFIGIIGFIVSGIMALGTISMLLMSGRMVGGGGGAGMMIVIVIVYGLFSLAAFYMALCLVRYASRIGLFIGTRHVDHLNAALDEQRKYFLVLGILLAVYVALISFTFIMGVVGAGVGFRL